jgi:peptidyl-prolyl cis-trans isomerase D
VARESAEAALKRVQGGESFAAVAKELSQDPGSKDAGGDLDFFEAGVMDKSFEDVVFKLAKGEISGLVQTPFGFHIIKLTDIRPAVAPPFAEVKEKVTRDYLENEAMRLFYEYSEQVANITYEEPDSLQPAADAVKIKVQKSDWMTRDGGPGVLASPKVISAAFSDDVLLDGRNSEIIELATEHLLVLRVLEHEETTLKPLDAVQPEIEQQLRLQQAAEKARERGAQLLGQLESGDKSIRQAATAVGAKPQQVESVGRDNRELPVEIMRSLFRMPRPEEGKPTFAGVQMGSGDYALIALKGITDGSMEGVTVENRRNLKDVLSDRTGEGYLSHLVEDLRSSAEIVIPGVEE